MSYKELPPVEDLWEYFEYAPLTGKLYWKKKSNKKSHIKVGDEAGTLRPEGYRKVEFLRKDYKTHRLIWKFVKAKDPNELKVDHIHDYIDGVYKSNYWWNLRLATPPQNGANQKKLSNNTSGFKGVSLEKSTGRWAARIVNNRKQIALGNFNTPEEAHEAYKAKAIELNGEFARFE